MGPYDRLPDGDRTCACSRRLHSALTTGSGLLSRRWPFDETSVEGHYPCYISSALNRNPLHLTETHFISSCGLGALGVTLAQKPGQLASQWTTCDRGVG